jgi:hypothetical protein
MVIKTTDPKFKVKTRPQVAQTRPQVAHHIAHGWVILRRSVPRALVIKTTDPKFKVKTRPPGHGGGMS